MAIIVQSWKDHHHGSIRYITLAGLSNACVLVRFSMNPPPLSSPPFFLIFTPSLQTLIANNRFLFSRRKALEKRIRSFPFPFLFLNKLDYYFHPELLIWILEEDSQKTQISFANEVLVVPFGELLPRCWRRGRGTKRDLNLI